MAVPADMTIESLRGKFTMNKNRSKEVTEIMKFQNISFFTYTAVGFATLHIHNRTLPDQADARKIKIPQTITGGLKGTCETRIFDWDEREHKDYLFGEVKGKSRMVKGLKNIELQTVVADDPNRELAVKDHLLNDAFLDPEDGVFGQSWVERVDGAWTAEQVWGFETVDGERKYTRRVVVAKPHDARFGWLVYDYVSKNDYQWPPEEADEWKESEGRA